MKTSLQSPQTINSEALQQWKIYYAIDCYQKPDRLSQTAAYKYPDIYTNGTQEKIETFKYS